MSIYTIIYLAVFAVLLFISMELSYRTTKCIDDTLKSHRDFLNDVKRAIKKWENK